MATNNNQTLVSFFLLGACAGIPFLLIASTIVIWLQESGSDFNIISVLSWCTAPYALKFLWAPVFDLYKIPWLSAHTGQKKSWLILVQFLLATCIYLISTMTPSEDLKRIIALCLLIAVLSSSQDLLIEGYRTANFNNPKKRDLVIGADVCGFRTGMILATTLPLYLANYYSWSYAFKTIAILIFIGILNTLSCHEPLTNESTSLREFIKTIKKNMTLEVICTIFLFILSFKSIDIVISNFIKPYFYYKGFSKLFLAKHLTVYGSLLAILGVITTTKILQRTSIYTVFKYTLIGQILCCFCLQFGVNIDTSNIVLLAIICATNFISGGHQVVLWNILTKLTNQQYSATYFALFTSISAFSRIIITSTAGMISSNASIELIYTLAVIGSIPSYLLLIHKLRL